MPRRHADPGVHHLDGPVDPRQQRLRADPVRRAADRRHDRGLHPRARACPHARRLPLLLARLRHRDADHLPDRLRRADRQPAAAAGDLPQRHQRVPELHRALPAPLGLRPGAGQLRAPDPLRRVLEHGLRHLFDALPEHRVALLLHRRQRRDGVHVALERGLSHGDVPERADGLRLGHQGRLEAAFVVLRGGLRRGRPGLEPPRAHRHLDAARVQLRHRLRARQHLGLRLAQRDGAPALRARAQRLGAAVVARLVDRQQLAPDGGARRAAGDRAPLRRVRDDALHAPAPARPAGGGAAAQDELRHHLHLDVHRTRHRRGVERHGELPVLPARPRRDAGLDSRGHGSGHGHRRGHRRERRPRGRRPPLHAPRTRDPRTCRTGPRRTRTCRTRTRRPRTRRRAHGPRARASRSRGPRWSRDAGRDAGRDHSLGGPSRTPPPAPPRTGSAAPFRRPFSSDRGGGNRSR